MDIKFFFWKFIEFPTPQKKSDQVPHEKSLKLFSVLQKSFIPKKSILENEDGFLYL